MSSEGILEQLEAWVEQFENYGNKMFDEACTEHGSEAVCHYAAGYLTAVDDLRTLVTRLRAAGAQQTAPLTQGHKEYCSIDEIGCCSCRATTQ